MSEYIRRLEASRFSWEMLSEQQKLAVEAAAGWLVDAIDALPSLEPSRTNKPGFTKIKTKFDIDRRSQLGFIDGDRGTGKSSVLFTIQALTEENKNEEDNNNVTPPNPPIPKAIMQLKENRNKIQWLEPLDMEPLSDDANLFAAILVRIGKVLDTNMEDLPPLAAALAKSSGYESAYDKLRQLQNDAAIVWDRRDGVYGNEDPQTRALRINQAEKAGLELNRRIGEVLDEIAYAERNNGKQENILFVLPVDDFDIAPCHCLDLLRLIRMITTPRLFFMMAGNREIAELVLKLHTEGDLLKLSLNRTSFSDEIQEFSAEIAANNIRKLLPPGQRAQLKVFSIKEALSLSEKIEDGKNVKANSLREKLKLIEFEVNQAPTKLNKMTLLSFLIPYEDCAEQITIAEWLCATPRQLRDRIKKLDSVYAITNNNGTEGKNLKEEKKPTSDERNLTEEKKAELSIEYLFWDISSQISEDGFIPYRIKKQLLETFDTSSSISLDLCSLRVEQIDSEDRLVETDEYQLVKLSPASLTVSIASGVESGQQSIGERKQQERIRLNHRLGTSILFAHDLVASLWGGYLRSLVLTYNNDYDIDFGTKLQVRWKIGIAEYLAVNWKMPKFWTFRDLDRFTIRWNEYYKQYKDQTDQADHKDQYGKVWLAALLEVIMNETPSPKNDVPEQKDGLATKWLKTLLVKFVDEKPTRRARMVLRESALVRILLLFAPEYKSGLEFQNFIDELPSNNENNSEDSCKLDLKNLVTSEIYISDKIRQIRAYNWYRAFINQGDLSEGRIKLCEQIAPGVAWHYIITDIKAVLIKLGKTLSDRIYENIKNSSTTISQLISDSKEIKGENDDIANLFEENYIKRNKPDINTDVFYDLLIAIVEKENEGDQNKVGLQQLLRLITWAKIIHQFNPQNISDTDFNSFSGKIFVPTEKDIRQVQELMNGKPLSNVTDEDMGRILR